MDRDLFPDVEPVDATPLQTTEDDAAHYGSIPTLQPTED